MIGEMLFYYQINSNLEFFEYSVGKHRFKPMFCHFSIEFIY